MIPFEVMSEALAIGRKMRPSKSASLQHEKGEYERTNKSHQQNKE
jgi:hypothetical protein